jgi:hypothetical protein
MNLQHAVTLAGIRMNVMRTGKEQVHLITDFYFSNTTLCPGVDVMTTIFRDFRQIFWRFS